MLKKYLPLFFVVSGLITITVLSRFVGHVWNFTLVGGMAIFAGAFFKKKIYAFAVVLLSLLISDAVIGFHNQMPFVYLAFVAMMVLGFSLGLDSSRLKVIGTSFLASLLFFLITNFFVWFEGAMYAQTFAGLTEAYVMGLPFFRNQLIADVASCFVLFEMAKVMATKFAPGTRSEIFGNAVSVHSDYSKNHS